MSVDESMPLPPVPTVVATASAEGSGHSSGQARSAVGAPARLVAVEALLAAAPLASVELQSIVSMLRQAHGAFIAAVSIVTPDRQTYLAIDGLDVEYTEVRDEVSFCAHVVAGGQPLAVLDALHDRRFAPNPFVADRIVASYVGVPICDEEGLVLGSLCLYSTTPGGFDASVIPALIEQAAIVSLLLRSISSEFQPGVTSTNEQRRPSPWRPLRALRPRGGQRPVP